MQRKNLIRSLAATGGASALALAGIALPSSAALANDTVCEPGYTSTTFSTSSTGFEPAGALTVQNTSAEARTIDGLVQSTNTLEGSVTGSLSVESVLSPVKAELSATASASASWTAGATIPIEVPANGEATVTYGYSTVEFAGSQRFCQSNGQFGPATNFSGTLPTATRIVI